MKIAVCFCGQLRTALLTHNNIKSFLGELYPNCDFFIHSWNRNKDKNYNGTIIGSEESYIGDDTINKINEIYQPKKFLIEDYNVVIKRESVIITNNYELFGPLQPFWYSFMKSVDFKREYEIENGFEYDFVLKLRPDIIFPKERKLKHLLELFEKGEDGIFIENTLPDVDIESEFVDDVLFFAKSKIMDIASQYFTEYNKKYKNDMKEDWYMGHPLKYGFVKNLYNNSVKILEMVGRTKFHAGETSYTIYRKECIEYSPIDEYMKCFKCDLYHYKDARNSQEYLYINELMEEYEINLNIFDCSNFKTIYIDELKKK